MPSQPFLTLVPSVARTAAGNGDSFDLTQFVDGNGRGSFPMQLLLQADVTAVAGTSPSITFLVEDSLDGGVTWNTIGTFTAMTTVSKQVIQISISGVAQSAGFRWPFNPKRVRVRWTVSGTTPSLTSTVKAVVI